MKILVIGGAGFIGSHVVDKLAERGHVIGVFDKNLRDGQRECRDVKFCWVGNLFEEQLTDCFNAFQPDAVCHLAAQTEVGQSMRNPAEDARQNIVGTLRVLQMCREHKVRHLVYASSGGAAYGECKDDLWEWDEAERRHDEGSELHPISAYGISKATSEKYLEQFAGVWGVDAIALRYANVYGPRQQPGGEAGVVSIFADKILKDETVTINGDGECIRDYVYVADAADMTRRALEAAGENGGDAFEAFNVGTGVGTSVNALMKKLFEVANDNGLANRTSWVRGPEQPGDIRHNVLNCDKAHEVFGWRAETPLDEGLAKTVEWMKSRQ